jgi:peptidoglycan/LPS O-acetylase OafA/YrhL
MRICTKWNQYIIELSTRALLSRIMSLSKYDVKYRPDIDGIRAIAILSVLLFHLKLGFSGGFVGVDVFFVISGYLITKLIVKDLDSNKFDLRTFWSRRIKRIMPAAFVVLLITLVAGFFIMLPNDFEKLASSIIFQQFAISNYYFWEHVKYFDGSADTIPTLHTWSLALEEQFYLLYPLLLISMSKLKPKVKITILAIIALLSLILCQSYLASNPTQAFYVQSGRSWELILGGITALLIPKDFAFNKILSLLGLLMILFSVFSYNSLTPFPGISALVPCLGTALLIYSNSSPNQGFTYKLLSSKTMVNIGLISYSLYLWHWPIIAYSRYIFGDQLNTSHLIMIFLASFGLAILSYKYIEQPIRNLPKEFSKRKIFAYAALSMLVIISISLIIKTSHGLKFRFKQKELAIVEQLKKPKKYASRTKDLKNNTLARLGVDQKEQIDFIVWGDSHAMSLAPLIDEIAKEQKLAGVIAARVGTIPLINVWRPTKAHAKKSRLKWSQGVVDYIKKHKIKNVILVSRWEANIEAGLHGELDTLIVDNKSKAINSAESTKAFGRAYDTTINALTQNGCKVWVLGQVPLQDHNPAIALFLSKRYGTQKLKGINIDQHLSRQKNVISILSQSKSNTEFIDISRNFFDEKQLSKTSDDKLSFYRDDNHISTYGSQILLEQDLSIMMKQF